MAKVVIAGTVDVAPDARDAAIRDARPLIEEALGVPRLLESAGELHQF